MVLSMYYRDELSRPEIAKIIGLHASRISQIRAQAIQRLRAYLAELWAPRAAVAPVYLPQLTLGGWRILKAMEVRFKPDLQAKLDELEREKRKGVSRTPNG